MKKIFLFSSFIFIFFLNVSAATTPEKYEITINKVEVYNSTTGEWVLGGQGNMSFDIALANAGQMVGNYVSSASFTEGTYTKVRVTVSRTMTLRGAEGANYTTANTQVFNGDGQAVVSNNGGGADKSNGTFIVPSAGMTLTSDGSYFVDEINLQTLIIFQKGKSYTVQVKFDVAGTLNFAGGIVWVNAPNVTVSTQ